MTRKLPDWLRLRDVPAFYYHQTGDDLPSKEAVRHWMKHGKRDYTGAMVRLKHIVRGGLWMTRKAWVGEFINRVKGITIETTGCESTDNNSNPDDTVDNNHSRS